MKKEEVDFTINFYKKLSKKIYYLGVFFSLYMFYFLSTSVISLSDSRFHIENNFKNNLCFSLFFSINFFCIGFSLEILNFKILNDFLKRQPSLKDIFPTLFWRMIQYFSTIVILIFLENFILCL